MHRQRIPFYLFIITLFFAVFIDIAQFGLQFLLIPGWILSKLIGVVAWLVFFMFYKWRGVGFLDRQVLVKILLLIGTPVVEFFFDFAPAYTLMVTATYLIVRAEDVAIEKKIVAAETLKQLERVAERAMKRKLSLRDVPEEVRTYRARHRSINNYDAELAQTA